jgi:radical SAM protein with 4Fe4S-binding SPASM domain
MDDAQIVGPADDVVVVYGARRAAVFDFRDGAVYSVNSAGAAVLRAVERGDPLDEDGRAFAAGLVAGGLFVPDPPHPAAAPAPPAPGLDFLWIELTGKCNLGCGHCYAGSQNPALFPTAAPTLAGPPLTFEQWDDVLRQAAELGCRAVQFIGGEALLDRRLFRLIDRARAYGYTYVEVYTNGTLLTERAVGELARRDVRLAVSLHGASAAVHDGVVGLRGSFDRTVRGLRLLAERDVAFRVGGVAVAENQHEILQVAELGAALGADETRIDIARPTGDGPAPPPPDDPALLAGRWLLAPNFVADRQRFEHNRRWNACWAGKLNVAPDGRVMPCIMGRDETMGNAAETPLADILAGPAAAARWGLTKDQVAVCRDCEYRYACGDCRPLAAAGGDRRGKTARCTYDPSRGDWGRPWSDERFPGPAAEGDRPRLELTTGCLAANGERETGGAREPGAAASCVPHRPTPPEPQPPCNPQRAGRNPLRLSAAFNPGDPPRPPPSDPPPCPPHRPGGWRAPAVSAIGR